MSIDDPNKIDFLSIESPRSKIILAISDHWEWTQPLEHVYALQEKLNTYATFVESGQIWEVVSEQIGDTILSGTIPIEIKLFVRCEPPPIFFDFIRNVQDVFATLGVMVSYELRLE
jgi:hypothetical protein